MTSKLMHVTTPQILWHGGGICNGKPDPVYSVDYHPKENVLLTTGIDASTPPRGSVRLWMIEPDQEQELFLVDFSEHPSVINVARFSPCGTMIASASDKQVIVYRVPESQRWAQVEDIKQVERKRFTPSLNDIVDLQWSPDSSYIIIGALEQKPEIIRIASKDKQRENSLLLPSHGSYVQGVAWDPYNLSVVTQSADRSVKVHKLTYRDNTMVKLAPNGHCTIKMYANTSEKEELVAGSSSEWQSVDNTATVTEDKCSVKSVDSGSKKRSVGVNLFADSNVPSSFRRLTFTPDGSLLIVPTGVYRPQAFQPTPNLKSAPSKASSNGSNPLSSSSGANYSSSFCTHIFTRNHFQHPAISLTGLEDPSVGVRCCPRLFKFIAKGKGDEDQYCSGRSSALFQGDYRMIFAVVTITSVYLYDTQHAYPLAKFRGLHYAPINDAAWSSDGRVLTMCSSDGYLSFIRFREGALGELLELEKVPQIVKASQPGFYGRRQTEQTLPELAPPSTPSSIIVQQSEKNAESEGDEQKLDELLVADHAEKSEEAEISSWLSSKGPTLSSENQVTLSNSAFPSATSNSSLVPSSGGKKRKRIQPEKVEDIRQAAPHPSFSPDKKPKSSPLAPSLLAIAISSPSMLSLDEDNSTK